MPDTLCYYDPFIGSDGVEREPIVKRVEACNTKLRYAALDNELYDSALLEAALTRQAIEDWARGHLDIAEWLLAGCKGGSAAWQTRRIALVLLAAPDHAACNKALHALADLLEKEQSND